MRELRNTKIIAVDHGYGNMKTANTVTPTGIKAYETEPIFTGNILEYNGIYYRIGEGHKEFIPDKAMDEEYYLLTLPKCFILSCSTGQGFPRKMRAGQIQMVMCSFTLRLKRWQKFSTKAR